MLLASEETDPEVENTRKVLFANINPDITNGFKVPDFRKVSDMVLYFAKFNTPFTAALNKLLFYADFGHYKKSGYSISGICYKAIQNSVFPENYHGIYNYVINTGLVSVKEITFGENIGERFVANNNAEPESFSEEEQATMKMVAEKFKSLNTKQIVDLCKQETAWQPHVDVHNRIRFDYAFELQNID